MRNLPRIQAGMRSRAYQHLVLGHQERRIRHFHDTLMETLRA
jgi:Ring hydroxylating alpha subunit (catalytic domain)